MAVAEQVVIDLIARTENLERGFARARQETTQLNRGVGALKGLLAGVSAVALAREFIRLADASKQINAQLQLATRTFGTFAQAQTDVARIANETRGSLSATASLYGNFTRATQQLGGTQAQAARATETFSKALKIGGADANQAASATLQFGQALASGALRGDEFNSIAEASPRILKLVADAIGVTQGEVRGLAAEGKLTSDVLFKALTDRKFTAGIDAEFKQIPPTFGDAMQQVENAAITTFGAFDEGGEFTNALAGFISRGAKGFADLADSAREEGQRIRATFGALADVFDPILAGAQSVFSGVRSEVDYTRESIGNILRLIDNVSGFAAGGANTINDIGSAVQQRFLGNAGRGRVARVQGTDLAGRFERDARQNDKRIRLQAAVRRLEGQGYIVPLLPNGLPDEANIRRRPDAPTPPRPKPKGKKSKLKNGTSKKALTAAELLRAVNNDLVDYTSNIGQIETDRDRERAASRRFEVVFGREGQDFDNPFAGVENNDKAIEQAAKAREEVNDMLFRRQEQDIQTLASLWETAFTRGSKGIFEQFKAEGIRAVALILAQLAVGKSLSAAISGATGPNSGGIFAAIGNVIASTATKRAGGGNVIAGQPYSINDDLSNRGELFVPSQSGKIYPTGSLKARASGGGNTTIVQQSFTLDARGGITTPELLRYVNTTAKTEAARAGKVAYQQSPTRVQAYNTLGT